MSSNVVNQYPSSAITTWSGFVYQGKVALYHCLRLINEGKEDFSLQLDSSDDFAIYEDNKLTSAHQVKAKISKYRSGYADALEKSSKIELDRTKGITRYFHVSVDLDDTNDHIGINGEVVKFYSYKNKKYCGLGEIENLTKDIIKEISLKNKVNLSETLINNNYCILSEKISNKALEIHKLVQIDGQKANEAAYNNRIHSKNILNETLDEKSYNDKEYSSLKLKSDLYNFLETKLDQSLESIPEKTYFRSINLFNHIRSISTENLKSLCQLMKPSERFNTIQKSDIRRYSDLIEKLDIDPILKNFPHYKDRDRKFFLPTALDIRDLEDKDGCTSDLLDEMESNEDLLKLLFEYNHLIAYKSVDSFIINTKYTHHEDLSCQEVKDRIDSNITKSFCLKIINQKDAEAALK